MKYTPNLTPKHYYEILEKSKKINFEMYSQEDLGLLLRFLTVSKKNPKVLELGTGTGLSLCWIIEALGKKGSVISIEKEQDYLKIAATFFGNDSRVQLIHQDAHLWIQENKGAQFDLIFADTWAGKFTDLEAVLAMVKPGGFYLVDDLKFQSDWPRSHQDKVIILMEKLKCREDFFSLSLDEGSGFMVLCKKQS